MKSKAPHCTIRNSKLFCGNCGGEQVIPYPIAIEIMTAMTEAFCKIHAKCDPVWKQPEAPQDQSVLDRAQWWLQHGERGTSSNAIWDRMVQGISRNTSHPCDPDDFRRCYLLLKAIPEWRAQLHKMKDLSPVWSALVDNWDKLTAMLEDLMAGKKVAMYAFMKTLGA